MVRLWALASKGPDFLGQQLALLVAVAQPARESIAPAPDGAIGSLEPLEPLAKHS